MNKISFIKKHDKKLRNPKIDFIRIIGMFAIIIHHLIVHGNAIQKLGNYNEINLLNILCMWHVSSFGIISGLVGNNTHKFSNLLYLWILVVFYSFIIYMIYNKIKYPFFNKDVLLLLFPVVKSRYWYWTTYFGLYPFLPFINGNLSLISRIQFKKCMYFMIGIFIIWSSYYSDPFIQNNGHSSFTLLTYYVYGCYINKYIFSKNIIIVYRILICILCTIVFIIASLMTYNINIKNSFPNISQNIKNIFKVETNSFPMILQVFSITIFIAQIQFNKYISQIITFVGPLTFDIYIIHENSYIHNHYIIKIFNGKSNNLSISNIYFLIIKNGIYIFSICLFFAYIRNTIFRILKIKNICNYFEIIAGKILNYFI